MKKREREKEREREREGEREGERHRRGTVSKRNIFDMKSFIWSSGEHTGI